MNAKPYALSALAAVVLCIALAGCTSPIDTARYERLYHSDEMLAQQSDTYSVTNYRGSLLEDGVSWPGEVHVGDLSGSMTLLGIAVPEGGGELSIACGLEDARGDIKFVFVALNDKRVETLCEGAGTGSLMRSLEPGEYALKAVGVNGGGDITARVKASDGIEAFVPGDAFDEPASIELAPIEPIES